MMSKTILITGATAGIGLEAAKRLTADGHRVLWHGRSADKLARLNESMGGELETYVADLSSLAEVEALAKRVAERHERIDVLLNNAGVYDASGTTVDGLDFRFAVNTVAPYLLTQRLLPRLGREGRVINLSSAAQAPVDAAAFKGGARLSDHEAYAQSKLALTMWTRVLAHRHGDGPTLISVNPGSLLATKMVRDNFGVPGKDVGIGADILIRLALEDGMAARSGDYFDNDRGRFGPPHPDALDSQKAENITRLVEQCSILAP